MKKAFFALAALAFWAPKAAAQDTLFAEQKSDCPVAFEVDLAKKYVVPTTTVSSGADPSELDGAICFIGGSPGNNEIGSSWFGWQAPNDLLLEFKITPIGLFNDLDFVLFELQGGDCPTKSQVRCMASSCAGATGIRKGEPDFSEPPNCNLPDQNNFLAPIAMPAGRRYALAINNFTATGDGFILEFNASPIVAAVEIEAETPSFSIAPNPARDALELTFSQPIFFKKLEIFDAAARLVAVHFLIGESTANILLDGLPAGLFVVRASGEKGSKSQKMIRLD